MSSPPSIPDHTLLRPIGRGSYGEVWLARNVMGAPRAVKIIWRGQFESERPYEREFAGIQRYEPVSRSADGLVHVLHVGRNDAEGYLYYVMELADDLNAELRVGLENEDQKVDTAQLVAYQPRTLRNDLKRVERVPTADCLRLGLEVCGGLAQLHRKGLVHRDVKPGNIIFVHGRAKLADIGLVSAGGEGRTFVGTEGYIPPEGPGSPLADLYALGVVLYETSTGYSPDRFPDVPAEWFRDDATEDALELHEVISKACESQRENRYQTAEAMHADLALLQSGQSVRRVRALEVRALWAKRIGWAAALVAALAIVGFLFADWRAREATKTTAKETTLRTRAEAAERRAREQLNAALFEQARALVASREMGHRTRALEALRSLAGMTNGAEIRRVAFAALSQPDLRLKFERPMSSGGYDPAPDPRMERMAICAGRAPVQIYSVPDWKLIATLPPSVNRSSYLGRWSSDGRYLGVRRQMDSSGREGQLELWEVSETPKMIRAGIKLTYGSFSFHPREPVVMIGRVGGGVTLWDVAADRPRREFALPSTAHALQYSPDGERFAASYNAGSNQWVIACHDTATLKRISMLDYPEPVQKLAWHPSGRWITMAGESDTDWHRTVRLMDANTGAARALGRHKLKASELGFSGDGAYLLSTGWDQEMICWDLRTFERAFTLAGVGYHQRWNGAGTQFAAMLANRRLQLYDFESPACRELKAAPNDGLRQAVFSPDGRWLAGQDVRGICVWDLSRKTPPFTTPKPASVHLFFSSDSTELFAVKHDYLRRWRLASSATSDAAPVLEELAIHVPPLAHLAGIASNDLVMTTSQGVELVALSDLNLRPGRLTEVPPGIGTVSPDGCWLGMIYSFQGVVRVYRLPEVQKAATLSMSNAVMQIAFSPAGDELAIVHRDGVELWDTATWKLKHRQAGKPVAGGYVLYPPDGEGLWMVTHFRNAGLYDRRTFEPIFLLPQEVLPIALSADGRQLAVSLDTQRVQLWDFPAVRAQFRELGIDW